MLYKFYYDINGFHCQEIKEYELRERVMDGKLLYNGNLLNVILKNGSYYTFGVYKFEWWKAMVRSDLKEKLAKHKEQVERLEKILGNA